MSDKQRIAIIGAGPSGLSTAFHLTNDADWQNKYDITVYQMGWRAGGKGATGRGIAERIEEHGIHGFTSFYFTATSVVRDCYRELYPSPDTAKIENPPQRVPQSANEVFLGNSFAVGVDFLDGKWDIGDRTLPQFEGTPWDDELPDFDAALVRDRLAALVTGGRLGAKWFFRLFRLLQRPVSKFLRRKVRRSAAKNDYVDPKLARYDYLIHLLIGILNDDVLDGGLDALDSQNFREWLIGHGVHPMTLAMSVVQTVPNILFQYARGDSTRPPKLSAASYLGWTLRTLAGRGDGYYFFRNGTGEGVVLPMYEVLRERGVQFEFFHKLTGVQTEGDRVTQLDFDLQAELKPEIDQYQPLRQINAADQWVWPNEPLWDQLTQDKPENWDFDGDYEWWWSGNVGTKTLAVGSDFDTVVMAVPPSVWNLVLPEPVANSGTWKANFEAVPTTATIATQIWLRKTTEELGWAQDWDDDVPNRWLAGTFPNPYNAMVEFSDLIEWEQWDTAFQSFGFDPKGLIYLCGQIDDDALTVGRNWATPDHPMYRQMQKLRAETAAFQYFRNFGVFLPGARRDSNDRTDHTSIDFEELIKGPGLLLDGVSGVGESTFLKGAYTRVNVSPNERYCTAPPGTAEGRMKPWESGFANMVPAGDWVYTGINVGCFEGAMVSGALASHALIGSPSLASLPNYHFLRPDLATEQVTPRLG